MTEVLAYYMLIGIAVNVFAILRYNANPPGGEIVGAIFVWPLVLFQLINSFMKGKK